MNSLPENWTLIEEYEGNFIFENSNNSFCVNIDYIPACEYPYSVSFIQLKGQLNQIGTENGRYSTHSHIIQEAYRKACEMMSFINQNV